MTYSFTQLATATDPMWFCLRAQPKREHIAAAGLRRQQNIPCFSPRLRFRKDTRRGAVWFVEAMFPGYLFAHFVYSQQRRGAEHSPGVVSLVTFGERIAVIESAVIASLQRTAGEAEVVTIDPEIKVGQPVQIIQGPLRGIEASGHEVVARKRTCPGAAGLSRSRSGNGASHARGLVIAKCPRRALARAAHTGIEPVRVRP